MSDDGFEMPELSARFGAVRRSPRKKQNSDGGTRVGTVDFGTKGYAATTTSRFTKQATQSPVRAKGSPAKGQTRRGPRKPAETTQPSNFLGSTSVFPEDRDPADALPNPARPRTILGEIPILPPHRINTATLDLDQPNTDTNLAISISATSANRMSPKHRYAKGGNALKLTHVDSLLLPLSRVALNGSSMNADSESESEGGIIVRRSPRKAPEKTRFTKPNAMQFILGEARCNDDSEDSGKDDSEDEDTDLSGFVVDDDAELSFYNSECSENSDSDRGTHQRGKRKVAGTRRLQRGRPVRQNHITISDSEEDSSGECSNKENEDAKDFDHGLEKAMKGMHIHRPGVELNTESDIGDIEVIDLTSSPIKAPSCVQPPKFDLNKTSQKERSTRSPVKKLSSDDSTPFDDSDAVLKFSPPRSWSPMKLPAKTKSKMDTGFQPRIPLSLASSSKAADADQEIGDPPEASRDAFTTPPATPPGSPSKLKSPSKLLSPSKKPAIPRLPHRQSTDAFWDLNLVNEWNDAYSPKKEPAASPRKGFARFQIWEDSDLDVENDDNEASSDSLPSPCASPSKTKSPSKPTSKEREAKQRLLADRKAERERKKTFDASKESLARTLFADLDTHVTDNKLSTLSASTGGVQIIWSKTLRSTAGRANWKRTVLKASGSPVKGDLAEVSGVKVAHYASIELATKVIDSESRLVNTLAHEFCHLANFMVSGICDQPHGAQFKVWAGKVTRHLRNSEDPLWRKVEVTTKHGYVIQYKYVWVCAGREQNAAMSFLNMREDEGCGAEYGRHSRSIDVDRQRCGRCRGRLVQVRPTPKRGSPSKKMSEGGTGRGRRSSGESVAGLEKTAEVIELSD